MTKVIAICENDKCGERFGGSEKERSGFCRNCSTEKGRKTIEDSYNEIHRTNQGALVENK